MPVQMDLEAMPAPAPPPRIPNNEIEEQPALIDPPPPPPCTHAIEDALVRRAGVEEPHPMHFVVACKCGQERWCWTCEMSSPAAQQEIHAAMRTAMVSHVYAAGAFLCGVANVGYMLFAVGKLPDASLTPPRKLVIALECLWTVIGILRCLFLYSAATYHGGPNMRSRCMVAAITVMRFSVLKTVRYFHQTVHVGMLIGLFTYGVQGVLVFGKLQQVSMTAVEQWNVEQWVAFAVFLGNITSPEVWRAGLHLNCRFLRECPKM
jgi:hypothetical protein